VFNVTVEKSPKIHVDVLADIHWSGFHNSMGQQKTYQWGGWKVYNGAD